MYYLIHPQRPIFSLLTPLCGLSLITTAAVAEDSSSIQLPTVEVTGELLPRTVQDSGNSVIVIDQNALEQRPDLGSVRDILRETPNITDVTGTGKAATVRGIDGTGPAENANAFFAGSRPRLNWQIDGRSATYNEVVFGDIGIWDLDRIEIFRGPQSSLVGRNAIAGTIRIETRDPEQETQAAGRIEAGNLSQRRLSLMYNQPLTDTLAVRFAADAYERQSPVDYDAYPGVDDPADIRGDNLRAKLLYTPHTEYETRWLLTLNNTGYEAPNGEIVVRPFEDQRSNFPDQPVHKPRSKSLGLEFSSLLSDVLRFELIMSATDMHFRRESTPDGSRARVETEELVIEPRLYYSSPNGSEWVAGTWFYQAEQDEWIQFFGIQSFDDSTDTQAAYVEGLIPFADYFELTLGLRYETEHRSREGGDPARQIVDIEADNTYDAFLPKLGLSFSPNDQQTFGFLLSRGYNAGGGGITFGEPIVNYEYDEEYVNSLELFGRQYWLNNRLRTTQNLFFSVYEDMQLPFDLTPENSRDEVFEVRNADEVQTLGLELGISWQINDQWQIFSNLALLDTEITDYPDSSIEGNELASAPSASIQLGGLWNYGGWQAHLSGRYTDGWFTTVNNREGGETSSFSIIDASFSYQFPQHIKLYATVRNLLDEDEPIALYPGLDGNGELDSDLDTAVLTQPRTITAGLQVDF